MQRVEDTELIKKAAGGDRVSFELLLERYYMVMYKIAFKWCGNQSDAEDITQNACIKLARAIDQFRFDSAFSSWLYRLVINTAKDWQKSQHRHNHGDDSILETKASNAAAADESLYASQVMEIIDTLPDKERDAIILVFIEGLSHQDAAKRLQCKESTVSWRIHEARKKLAHQLGEDHDG